MRRLARRVTGHALGLVLSGGGAKGFGHVGAIRALEESGFQIDLVGGTSMGALVGGVYALGCDYQRMCELGATFARPRALFDYTLPLVSFFETRKVTRILKELSEGVRIEDLWLPYFCVSCNLTEGKQVVHRTGLLWEGMRASLAIPGVFSPVTEHGDLLVDGGAINNFPIDVMRGICEEGLVVGVSASPPRQRVQEYDLGPSVSGWEVLWSRLNPLRPSLQVPSILTNLMRSLEVNSTYRVATIRDLADLIIPLPVESFGTLDFASYERIIELGYVATRQYLNEWRAGGSAGLPAAPRGML
jgi:predicted acylesterase/phospholipase RssA